MPTNITVPLAIVPYNDDFTDRYEITPDRITFCKAWRWATQRQSDSKRILRVIGTEEQDVYSSPEQRLETKAPELIDRAIRYLFTNEWINGNGIREQKFMKKGIPRYRPQGNGTVTFCNIFVSDITRILQCEVPNNPDDTNVHNMKRWLTDGGGKSGWSQAIPIEQAVIVQEFVNVGKVAIMICSGDQARHQDHVGLVRPGEGRTDANGAFWPLVAQAGSIVSSNLDSSQSFGKLSRKEIVFFVHD